MQRLLDSDLEFLVRGGDLYVPLLFDPAIEKEIPGGSEHAVLNGDARLTENVILARGKYYVRSLDLVSLPESYIRIHTHTYEQLRSTLLRKYGSSPLHEVSLDGRLAEILFGILPHFVKRKPQLGNGGLKRNKPSREEIMELICRLIDIPSVHYEAADRFINVESLKRMVSRLEEHSSEVKAPRDGPLSAHELHHWLADTLEAQIVGSERERLRKALRERERLGEHHRRYVAALLYLAEIGSFELDGFGFFRRGFADDYVIYKHTGEYALSDYYGRIYLFPDCKVAVESSGPLSPLVIDRYKHPLLQDHESWQKICVRRFYLPEKEFNARNVIKALEEGIGALYYGYNSRRHNGYYKLESTVRHIRTVDFDEYRVARDHPKIASGEVEVKNSFIS